MKIAKIGNDKYITVGESTIFELKRLGGIFAVFIKISDSPSNQEYINIGDIYNAQTAEKIFNAIMRKLAQAKEDEVVDLTVW